MKEEFLITRQGKQFVLFAGLLDEAHQRGLTSIDTELVQVPADGNGQVAIVKAIVELEGGAQFSGIGDASPQNVSRNIVPHLIRMAETRAKARALRDAVNVEATSLEELSDGEDSAPGAQQGGGQTQGKDMRDMQGAARDAKGSAQGGGPQQQLAHANQVAHAGRLLEELGYAIGDYQRDYLAGRRLSDLTVAECSAVINSLNDEKKQAKAAQAQGRS